MLRKIISIENVGPFSKLSHHGEEWTTVVAIYGDNATGKTHISAILRAASSGNAAAIAIRKTVNASDPPRIEILTSDATAKVVKFDGKKWDQPYPRLLVFNKDFVHENVYVGRDIGPDQREQLYELAIGAAAVEAKARLEEASDDLGKSRRKTSELEDKLAGRLAPLGANLAELEATAPILATPAGLGAEKARLAQRQEGGGLASAPAFGAAPQYAPINFTVLRQLLDKSVDALAKEAEQSVRAHVAAHLDSAGENWLAQGVQYAGTGEECPYCAQSLAASELAKLFPKFFDDAYRKLTDSIVAEDKRFLGLQGWTAGFLVIVHANDKAFETWSKYTSLPLPPDVSSVDKDLRSVLVELRQVLEDKRGNPLQAMGADPRVAVLEKRALLLEQAIGAYGAWATQVSSLAAGEKANALAITAKLSSGIRSVELGLLRNQPGTIGMLVELKASRDAGIAAAAAVEAARLQLEKCAEQQSKKFIESVNDLLKDFGARFSIVNLANRKTSARVSADYQFLLKAGGAIKASAKSGSEPTFDTLLSQGDRSALGLAVFVAMARQRQDIGQCSVVFDDPFTSLDENRRRRTIELMRSLHEVAAQVIVLSHDKVFIRDVINKMGGAVQREIDPARQASNLLEWDAEQACRTDYARRLDQLTDFASKGSHGSGISVNDAWNDIRPLLEEYLRFRFPRFWESSSKSKLWLGDFVAAAKGNSGPHALALTPAQILKVEHFKDNTTEPHHGGGTQAKVAPTETELMTLIGEVLEFVTTS